MVCKPTKSLYALFTYISGSLVGKNHLRCLKSWQNCSNTSLPNVDGKNPAIGSLSHYLQGFVHPRWWSPDFFEPSTVSDASGFFKYPCSWLPLLPRTSGFSQAALTGLASRFPKWPNSCGVFAKMGTLGNLEEKKYVWKTLPGSIPLKFNTQKSALFEELPIEHHHSFLG